MTTATLTKETSNDIDYDVYKEEVRRKQLETKCRHISSETELIIKILNEIAYKISQEMEKREYISTEFESDMLEWEDTFSNITTSLYGIGNESKEIEDGLSQIYHYINKKTGVFISWPNS